MVESDPLLGGFLANYPSDRARLLIPAVIVSGIVAVVLNFTTAAVEAWWGPPLTIILMALVVLIVGWRVLHFWNREVMLYEHGFSYREGGRTVFFLYHELASIRQRAERLVYFGGLIRRTTYRYTLISIRGEKIVLTNLYKNVDRLMERLEQKLNALLEPQIIERLNSGEKVPFSDTLRVSKSGLHEGGRDLHWSEFGGYKAGGGQLTLLSRDSTAWLTLALPDIDNLAILIGLLKQQETRR